MYPRSLINSVTPVLVCFPGAAYLRCPLPRFLKILLPFFYIAPQGVWTVCVLYRDRRHGCVSPGSERCCAGTLIETLAHVVTRFGGLADVAVSGPVALGLRRGLLMGRRPIRCWGIGSQFWFAPDQQSSYLFFLGHISPGCPALFHELEPGSVIFLHCSPPRNFYIFHKLLQVDVHVFLGDH